MIDIHEFLQLKDQIKQLEKDKKTLEERIEKLEKRIPPRGPFLLLKNKEWEKKWK